MNVIPVELPFDLGAEQQIDMFLLQWHTSAPISGLTEGERQLRSDVLTQMSDWLCGYYVHCESSQADRPVCIVTPELSISIAHLGQLRDLAARIGRPFFAVVGVEFMDWASYTALLEEMPPEIDRALCSADRGGVDKVNCAAVLVGDGQGGVRTYFQPKEHKSVPEAGLALYKGRHVFFFGTPAATSSSRSLAFFTRICSDITEPGKVRDLRLAVENQRVAGHLPVTSAPDLAFVLQYNLEQDTPQFLDGVKAYFSPDDGVATQDSCLLLLNNASRDKGRVTSFGGSAWCFGFDRRWPSKSPNPTYWIRAIHGYHNHRPVALRDGREAIYWMRYKPARLVATVPGSRDSTNPFLSASAIVLNGTAAGAFADPSTAFRPIPPFRQWLDEEWREGELRVPVEFEQLLTKSQTESHLDAFCRDAYRSGVTEFGDSFVRSGHEDRQIQQLLATYCKPCRVPGRAAADAEPKRCCDRLQSPIQCTGIQHLPWCYGLLKESAPASAGLRVEIRRNTHALLQDGTKVAFLWGARSIHSVLIVKEYLASFTLGEVIAVDDPGRLIVLIKPDNEPDVQDVEKAMAMQITRGASADGVGHRGRTIGDITDGTQFGNIRVISDSRLANQVLHAASPAGARSALNEIVKQAIGRAVA